MCKSPLDIGNNRDTIWTNIDKKSLSTPADAPIDIVAYLVAEEEI